jgi:SAM-dependent methyltransferase
MSFCIAVLEDQGYKIDKNSVIVDFGCGEGNSVLALRKQGYKAFGCDMFEHLSKLYDVIGVKLERSAQSKGLQEEGLILPIKAKPYRLPFNDSSVDVVFSETVFEHIENIDEVVSEIARILKPGGVSFHHFPAKYSVLEQHMQIPFGGVIQNFPYFYFWSLLGWRRYYQTNMPAKKRALQNLQLLKINMFYRSESELRAIFGRYFSKVGFAEDSYFKVTPSRKSQLLGKINRYVPGVGKLYRTFWANALVAAKH